MKTSSTHAKPISKPKRWIRRGDVAVAGVPSVEALATACDLDQFGLNQCSAREESEGTTPACKFCFIDLFAGIGGLRIAFERAGGRCVFSSEWNKFSQQTYTANFKEQPTGDITQIADSQVPNHDVLVGGFPCQPFSHAGLKQGFQDTRGTLFFDVAPERS